MSVAIGPGAVFAGYKVESLLGRGGMGVVYRATDLSLERPVALKLIAPELAQDERFRARFLREPRLAAALDHPHVIPIHAAGEHDGQLYLAMRYVEGSDLRTVLEREGSLAPERALQILGQIAEALDAAHRRGLVHRDVKPANVLLDRDGHGYLTDFGISKLAGGASTDSGRVLGTLDYLAPEQIRGERVDGRTDCYALACVLYECLTGAPPFRRETEAETLWAHMQEQPPPLSGNSALDPVIRKALAKDGVERHDSCAELIAAASGALGHRPRELLPGLGLAAPSEVAAETPRGAFVGRGPELAELIAGLGDAFAGRGRLFLVGGEPGIGKSRLAEELIAHARTRGARVLVGRCWEAGGAPAYWPWVQSLRAYVRESDDGALRSQLGAGAAELAQIIPELRRRFDLPETLAPESGGARVRLFDAAAEFLRNASRSRPILLVLDDLHAADAPSLLLLQFLARELGSTCILLLGAYRDVDPIPGQPLIEMLAEVAREPVTRRLALRGLSEREVAQYVEMTASEIASTELVGRLHGETEGNPLFVGEIVRLLSVEGVPSESAAETRLAIPQTIHDVISRRLTHLSAECARMLLLASVIGREFELDMLARMGGVSENELLEILDVALTARVVSDVPDGAGRLRFGHVLIRDTLYDGLTSARRVRLHRLAVEALEALYGDDPGPHLAELAHHSVAGRDIDKGLCYARRAGDRALALLAYEEAARLYGMALEALELKHPPNEQARCELLLAAGEAEVRAGDVVSAKRAFLQAAGIARRLGLSRELARAAAGYGGRFMWARAAGDDQLMPLLEEGLAALAEQDVELRARLLARLAGVLRDEHSRARRDSLSREAVKLARRAGNPAALAYALDGRLAAISAPDTIAECFALVRELHDVAERIGDPERIVNALDHKRTRQVMTGDLREAEAALEAEGRLFDELRQPAQLWQVYSSRAMFALAAGRLEEAEELIPKAFAFGERALPDVAIPVYRLQSHALRDFQGRLEGVTPAIRDLVAEYPTRPAFRCALAHVHARLGHLKEAQSALDHLAKDHFSALPFDQEWLYGMSLLAETSVLLGDSDSGTVLYQLLAPWTALSAADHPEGFRGSIARYLGLLATMTRSWEAAELHFEDALAANAGMGARPWLAHTQNDYARMLHARDGRGDRTRAQALLDTARKTYLELNMARYAAAAAALADEVGTTT